MSKVKQILEGLTSIHEKLPADVMKNLTKKYNLDIRNSLLKIGVDIEKAEASISQLSGAKDPELNNTNNIFIFMYKDEIGCITKGKNLIYETTVSIERNYLKPYSQQSWKALIDNSSKIYVLDLEKYNTNQVKADRVQAKSGREIRVPGKRGTDKSGYPLDKEKYRRILATKTAKDNNFEEIINKSINFIKTSNSQIDFSKVNINMAPKAMTEFYENYYSFAGSLREILSSVKELFSEINYMKEYGEKDTRTITRIVMRIKDAQATAQKYLDKLK